MLEPAKNKYLNPFVRLDCAQKEGKENDSKQPPPKNKIGGTARKNVAKILKTTFSSDLCLLIHYKDLFIS